MGGQDQPRQVPQEDAAGVQLNRLAAVVLAAALPFAAGCYAINSAIRRGDVAAVEAELPTIDYRSNSGFASQACIANQPEVLKLLVEKGSALEESSGMASTLTHCLTYDRPEMTRYLLSGAGGRSVLAKGARPLIAKLADTAPSLGNITVLAAASGDEITGSLDQNRVQTPVLAGASLDEPLLR